MDELLDGHKRLFAKQVHEPAKDLSSHGVSGYGQPVPSTHPHLMHVNELMPGLELNEFKQRRAKFLTNIQKVYADKMPNFSRNKRAHLVYTL